MSTLFAEDAYQSKAIGEREPLKRPPTMTNQMCFLLYAPPPHVCTHVLNMGKEKPGYSTESKNVELIN